MELFYPEWMTQLIIAHITQEDAYRPTDGTIRSKHTERPTEHLKFGLWEISVILMNCFQATLDTPLSKSVPDVSDIR